MLELGYRTILAGEVWPNAFFVKFPIVESSHWLDLWEHEPGSAVCVGAVQELKAALANQLEHEAEKAFFAWLLHHPDAGHYTLLTFSRPAALGDGMPQKYSMEYMDSLAEPSARS